MAPNWEFTPYTKTYHRSQYHGIDPKNPANSAEGKVVVITGGGTGIGKAIAQAFIEAGAKAIAILSRRQNILEETKRELEAIPNSSAKILTFAADISDATALNEAFASVKEKCGPIDVAVANAAIMHPGTLATVDVDEWWKDFEVNLKGTLLTYRTFAANRANKTEEQTPVFINVNTAASHIALSPGMPSYGLSKFGSFHLVSWLAAEEKEIRAVSFHPGMLLTNEQAKAGAKAMGISADDINLPSGFAVWLASPRAAFVNGRMLWAHWDVDELEAQKDQIIAENDLVADLKGFPAQKFGGVKQ
ncbi:hypothetical protein LTR17_008957 [Elasticomyces elasticus]|nr:hypothetical protein LTR17_008957 [Elasticomyces elasticus]